MSEATEIIKISLPAIVVATSCVIIIIRFLKNDTLKMTSALNQENQKIIITLRLQAYERIILFLERIHLRNLIMRFNVQVESALQLQHEMNTSIRQEFDHNITQQLYISNEAWNLVKSVKESVLTGINTTASGLAPEATATELASHLLLSEAGNPSQVNIAILFIKKEVQELF